MSNKQVFPSWRYHKTEGAKIVHSKEESDWHEKKGWAETPAAFEPKEEKFEPKTSESVSTESAPDDGSENGLPKKYTKGAK